MRSRRILAVVTVVVVASFTAVVGAGAASAGTILCAGNPPGPPKKRGMSHQRARMDIAGAAKISTSEEATVARIGTGRLPTRLTASTELSHVVGLLCP
jgi:hypothetical protein